MSETTLVFPTVQEPRSLSAEDFKGVFRTFQDWLNQEFATRGGEPLRRLLGMVVNKLEDLRSRPPASRGIELAHPDHGEELKRQIGVLKTYAIDLVPVRECEADAAFFFAEAADRLIRPHLPEGGWDQNNETHNTQRTFLCQLIGCSSLEEVVEVFQMARQIYLECLLKICKAPSYPGAPKGARVLNCLLDQIATKCVIATKRWLLLKAALRLQERDRTLVIESASFENVILYITQHPEVRDDLVSLEDLEVTFNLVNWIKGEVFNDTHNAVAFLTNVGDLAFILGVYEAARDFYRMAHRVAGASPPRELAHSLQLLEEAIPEAKGTT